MNIVVTGVAPRCGTSAMMQLLLTNGWNPHAVVEQFPRYVAPSENPKGFWDVSDDYRTGATDIALNENECIKLWFPMFKHMDWTTVDLLVVMHRQDVIKQRASILRCAKAERLALTVKQSAQMFVEANKNINELSDLVKQLKIPMRYLRGSPNSVLHKIKEII